MEKVSLGERLAELKFKEEEFKRKMLAVSNKYGDVKYSDSGKIQNGFEKPLNRDFVDSSTGEKKSSSSSDYQHAWNENMNRNAFQKKPQLGQAAQPNRQIETASTKYQSVNEVKNEPEKKNNGNSFGNHIEAFGKHLHFADLMLKKFDAGKRPGNDLLQKKIPESSLQRSSEKRKNSQNKNRNNSKDYSSNFVESHKTVMHHGNNTEPVLRKSSADKSSKGQNFLRSFHQPMLTKCLGGNLQFGTASQYKPPVTVQAKSKQSSTTSAIFNPPSSKNPKASLEKGRSAGNQFEPHTGTAIRPKSGAMNQIHTTSLRKF